MLLVNRRSLPCSEDLARELELRAAITIINYYIYIIPSVIRMLTIFSRSSTSNRSAGAADTVATKPIQYKKEYIHFQRTYCRSAKGQRKFGIASFSIQNMQKVGSEGMQNWVIFKSCFFSHAVIIQTAEGSRESGHGIQGQRSFLMRPIMSFIQLTAALITTRTNFGQTRFRIGNLGGDASSARTLRGLSSFS